MTNWPTMLRHGAWLTLLVLAAVAVLHAPLLQDKIYSSSDMRSAETFKRLGDASLAAGEYPLWTPYVFTGMPSYASLAYTPDVYPLTKPIRVVTKALSLPPMTWLLLHLLILGALTAGYARWRCLSLPASAMAGALIIAVPNVAAWSAYGHGTKVGTFAWLPLTIWCLEGVLRTGRLRFVFGLAAAVAMQLLRGHVQIVYYTALLAAIVAGFTVIPALRDASRRPQTLRRVSWLGLAAVLALGAAMVLYLPVLDYQGHSIRGAGSQGGGAAYDYATGWSLPFSELDTLWWPTAAGYGRDSYVGGMPFTDYPNYVGLPVLLLAGCALLLRRDRWTWSLLAAAGLATVVALGKHSVIYDLFYHVLPGFKKFRVPVMILVVQQFALILLAAAGLDAVFARLRSESRPAWLGRPALVGVGLLAVVLLLMGTVLGDVVRSNSIATWQKMRANVPVAVLQPVADLAVRDALRLGGILLVALGAGVLAVRRRGPSWAPAAVIAALLVADYFAVDQPLLHPEKHLLAAAQQNGRIVTVPAPGMIREESAVKEFVEGNSVTDWLRRQGDRPRVWPLGEWAGTNLFAGQRIVSLGGYQAAKLKIYEEIRRRLFNNPPRVELVNLLAADYVASPAPLGDAVVASLRQMGLMLDAQPVFESADGVVYANASALPRAWCVDAFEPEAPQRDTTAHEPSPDVLDRVLRNGFDPRRTAILSATPDPVPQAGAAEAAKVEIEAQTDHTVRLGVDTPVPTVLVLADIYYPAWRVEVDGQPARLLRADYALRGVALPAGAHTVEFRYASSSYARGKVISAGSGLLIALGLLGSLWLDFRRRREDVA